MRIIKFAIKAAAVAAFIEVAGRTIDAIASGSLFQHLPHRYTESEIHDKE